MSCCEIDSVYFCFKSSFPSLIDGLFIFLISKMACPTVCFRLEVMSPSCCVLIGFMIRLSFCASGAWSVFLQVRTHFLLLTKSVSFAVPENLAPNSGAYYHPSLSKVPSWSSLGSMSSSAGLISLILCLSCFSTCQSVSHYQFSPGKGTFSFGRYTWPVKSLHAALSVGNKVSLNRYNQ